MDQQKISGTLLPFHNQVLYIKRCL